VRTLLPLLIVATSVGCLDLDGFVYNPVHCSTVGPDTCEDSGRPTWDQACVPCEEEYDWARDYDWIAGTLDDGTPDVRPVATAVERSTITTEDGEAELDVYVLPSHGEDPLLADVTVLYNHGNYLGIEHYAPRVRFLHEAGYRVVVWDYRGFGKSTEGAPNTDQFLADAHTFLDYAEGDLGVDLSRAVVYANSLGGIPAIEMSLDERPCAVMLEAAFTSMSAISRANSTTSFGESMFSQNRFDNIEKIADYAGPLMVLAADEDNFFPLEDQQALFDNAPGPKEMWIAEGAKHGIANGGVPEVGLTPYFAAMRSFLQNTAPACVDVVR